MGYRATVEDRLAVRTSLGNVATPLVRMILEEEDGNSYSYGRKWVQTKLDMTIASFFMVIHGYDIAKV